MVGIAEKPDIKLLLEDFSKEWWGSYRQATRGTWNKKYKALRVLMNEAQKEKMKQIQRHH